MIQFLWIHTDKICLPTVILWLIFIWMEAKIRWKDNRNIPHLDLCRPFAAHCIGYPVVTLGFGFKSYIGYRIRQRKQREVGKENEFYVQLLQQALPPQAEEVEKVEEQVEEIAASTPTTTTATQNNCKNTHHHHQNHSKVNHSNGSIEGLGSHLTNGGVNTSSKQQNNVGKKQHAEKENGCIQHIDNNHHHNHHAHQPSPEIIPNNAILSTKPSSKASNHLNFNNLQQSVKNINTTSYQQHQIQNGITKELNVPAKCSPYKNKDDHNTYVATSNKKEYEKEKIIKDTNYGEEQQTVVVATAAAAVVVSEPPSQKRKEKQQKDNQHQYHMQQHQSNASSNHNSSSNSNFSGEKNHKHVCEQCPRLDQETKRLKAETQSLKSQEHELRQKYENIKGCLQSKQKENEELQKQ
jgi:hypothetical protein